MGEKKVPTAIAIMMIVVAVLLDLFNLLIGFISLELFGWFGDVLAAMIFSIWFSHYGVSLGSSKNIGWTLVVILVDMLPFGDLTFPWAIRVGYLAFHERKEAPPPMSGPPPARWRL
jgi:hypothetical protein